MAKDLSIKKYKNKFINGLHSFIFYIRSHGEGIVIIVFLIMSILWVYIFWQYTLKVAYSEPVVTVNYLKVKEDDLNVIIYDLNNKEIKRGSINNMDVINPFKNRIGENGTLDSGSNSGNNIDIIN